MTNSLIFHNKLKSECALNNGRISNNSSKKGNINFNSFNNNAIDKTNINHQNVYKPNLFKDKGPNQINTKVNFRNIKNSNHDTADSSGDINSVIFDLTEEYLLFYNYKNQYSVIPSKKVFINKRGKILYCIFNLFYIK